MANTYPIDAADFTLVSANADTATVVCNECRREQAVDLSYWKRQSYHECRKCGRSLLYLNLENAMPNGQERSAA